VLLAALSLSAFFFGPPEAEAEEREFRIHPGKDYNQVRFVSEATLESFEGVSHTIEGTIRVDPLAPCAETAAEFSVDLASLDTGISMRNRHMRKNHLHAERFPEASYSLRGCLGPGNGTLADGRSLELDVEGEFGLHGVVRREEMEVEVVLHDSGRGTPTGSEGPVLHGTCAFIVKLSDYEIPRPEFLFLKVADEIQVEVEFWASSEFPADRP